MEKCSVCHKDFPEAAMNKMIQIIGKKAYVNNICPSCQAIVANNPSYYYMVEEKK